MTRVIRRLRIASDALKPFFALDSWKKYRVIAMTVDEQVQCTYEDRHTNGDNNIIQCAASKPCLNMSVPLVNVSLQDAN